ncbi:MAG: hypothetical protein QNK23_01640 [Crocinitomicaceae bacterium]|nr:hypothetical protein [Crocinitomicaceae bacterium]
MRFFKTNILTKLSGILVAIMVFTTLMTQQKWEGNNKVIHGDVLGYYAYLPALFIHDDLKFDDLEEYDSHLGRLVWVTEQDDGTVFIKYTSGMAIMYSPFFLTAHYLAEPLGYKANGFDPPYKVALVWSSFFYMIIGLIFLSKFLLLHFKDSVVAIVLLTIYFGTNAFHYYTGDMSYSHGYSFALVATFLYAASRWLSHQRIKWAVLAGISAGLFVLIRPVDIFFLLFIPLAGVASFSDLRARFHLFWQRKGQVIIMIASFVLMIVPQLMYYKYISGSYLFYSYSEEGFFFSNPKIHDILFSYRNGWLVYTPVMVLSLFGFLFLWKKKAKLGAFVFITFLLYLYVIASWWCWWYVGFGNRAFVNIYPILSIPLAYFIQHFLEQQWWKRGLVQLAIIGCVFLNLFQTKQYEIGTVHWGAGTEEAYWDSFWNYAPSQLYANMLEYPVTQKAILGIDAVTVSVIDTLSTESLRFDSQENCPLGLRKYFIKNGQSSDDGVLFTPKENFTMSYTIPVRDAGVIQISAWVKCEGDLFIISSRGEPAIVYNATESPREYDGDWKRLHLYTRIPDGLEVDSLDIFFWNQEMVPLTVDNLTISWCNVSTEIILKE